MGLAAAANGTRRRRSVPGQQKRPASDASLSVVAGTSHVNRTHDLAEDTSTHAKRQMARSLEPQRRLLDREQPAGELAGLDAGVLVPEAAIADVAAGGVALGDRLDLGVDPPAAL